MGREQRMSSAGPTYAEGLAAGEPTEEAADRTAEHANAEGERRHRSRLRGCTVSDTATDV
jgi:hypothetical protein